ncbi:MAG: hypothetical protein ACO1N2_01830 [Candidatus Saccharimonadota bacterium]
MNEVKKYATTQRAVEFLKSPEGVAVYEQLLEMVDDKGYNTASTYSPSSENGNLLFIDKHMSYLCSHAGVVPAQYLSNLRLVTKVR